MADPGKIVIAGDWHGNTRWATHVIEQAAKALEGEEEKVILQLGDFLPTFYRLPEIMKKGGPEEQSAERLRWAGGYLWTLEQTLRRHEMQLWFIDGNHEDWEMLSRQRELITAIQHQTYLAYQRVPMSLPSGTCRIFWLPRGCRWQWHGREWLAFGGAGSPNRSHLIEGWNWWPDEEITTEQVEMAAAGGTADVLVSHELPAGVPIQYNEPPRSWLKEDLSRCEKQREQLQLVADAVTPGWVIHGHHHRLYRKTAHLEYGQAEVLGLAADGARDNWLVFDVREMKVEDD